MSARAGQARPKLSKNHRKGIKFEAIFTSKIEPNRGRNIVRMMIVSMNQHKTLSFRDESSKLKNWGFICRKPSYFKGFNEFKGSSQITFINGGGERV